MSSWEFPISVESLAEFAEMTRDHPNELHYSDALLTLLRDLKTLRDLQIYVDDRRELHMYVEQIANVLDVILSRYEFPASTTEETAS